eukprot:TRINITY_DN6819_c0_g1_i1.p1 TRINITY_DN6819_c0_g1~~TRINITY_DN6819_c0_g1_i1.p1  ORF type:complete len:179 (-),score=32.44 TRINITY_DN6819_c0_g1_i1:120-656(-)
MLTQYKVKKVIQKVDKKQERKLSLAHFELKKIPIPNTVFNNLCNCLVELDLSNNKLPEVPSEIGNLTKLEVLNLRYNELGSLPNTISKLQSLKELHLGANKFGAIPPPVCELSSLELLDCFQNRISRLPCELAQLVSLKRLSLFQNPWHSPSQETVDEGFDAVMLHLRTEYARKLAAR